MVLPVVKYGDPVLRRRGENIVKIDVALKQLISNLFETMYAAHGIGLAAQQIGVAKQVAVVDVRGVKDRPSQLWVEGHTCDVDSFMPLVLINPLISPSGDFEVGPEGCLSFPEIYGDIRRPSKIEVTALNERGESFHFTAGGLLARAIQHEADLVWETLGYYLVASTVGTKSGQQAFGRKPRTFDAEVVTSRELFPQGCF